MKPRALVLAAAIFAGILLASQQAEDSTFEVASVKPVSSAAPRGRKGGPNDPNRFAMGRITLKALALMAYGVPEEQLSGGPAWIQSDLYEIDAKPAKPVSHNQMMAMLRSLLADRFQLHIRREQKSVAVSVLTAAKGGPKFGPRFHKVDEETLTKEITSPDPKLGLFLGGTMKEFASLLERNMRLIHPQGEWSPGPPLRDQTGLEGFYAIYLAISGPYDDLEAVVQEQLGLKIENRKLTLDIVVIDSVQKPSPN